MKIGIPKESMQGEGRVALIPGDCKKLVDDGLVVFIEQGAGKNSGYADSVYKEAGVEILSTAEALYAASQLVVKVKQPLQHDLQYLRQRWQWHLRIEKLFHRTKSVCPSRLLYWWER